MANDDDDDDNDNIDNTDIVDEDDNEVDKILSYEGVPELNFKRYQELLIRCKKGRNPRLVIASLALTAVPQETTLFPWLKILVIEGNPDLTSIPACVSQLTDLQQFRVPRNGLTSLPDLSSLKELQIVVAGFNRLHRLPDSICYCQNLTEIIVPGNKLVALPLALHKLAHLRNMDITENPTLQSPPETILVKGMMTYIRYLKCLDVGKDSGKCNLKVWGFEDVPHELCDLHQITDLALDSNNLKLLPDDLARMTNLKRLGLQKNRLTVFPSVICQLTTLEYLNISLNKQIRRLPCSVGNLTRLTKLITDIGMAAPPMSILVAGAEKVVGYLRAMLLASETLSIRLVGQNLGDFPPELESLFMEDRFAQPAFSPSAATRMLGLQSLDLSQNQISILSPTVARFSSLLSLKLGSNAIKQLPTQLSSILGLTELDVSRNTTLQNLPLVLATLKSLQIFGCAGNGLTQMLRAVTNCLDLRLLSMEDNQITELPDFLAVCSKLTKINASKNVIVNMSPELGSALQKLEDLDLTDNQLSQLPAEMKGLTALTRLALSRNPDLQKIPTSVGSFTSITELGLKSNAIMVMPPFLLIERSGDDPKPLLSYLQTWNAVEETHSLDLRNCELDFVPDDLFDVAKHVQFLVLSQNKLWRWPKLFPLLSNLAILDVCNNSLKHFLLDALAVPNLRCLRFSHNSVSVVFPSIEKLDQLMELHCDHNQIEQLPTSISKLTNLTVLCAQNNGLRQFQNEIPSAVTSLRVLRLQENRIQCIPLAVGLLSELEVLEVHDNPVVEPPPEVYRQGGKEIYRYLHNTELATKEGYLTLDNFELTAIPPPVFGITNILALDLSDNKITSIPRIFDSFRVLETIILDKNRLKNLPEQLSYIPTVLELSISKNSFDKLPPVVCKMTSLVSLIASHNAIQAVPESISALESLTLLDMSFNRINKLAVGMGCLTSIVQMDMQGNDFDAIPFSLANLLQMENFFFDYETVGCPYPVVWDRGLKHAQDYMNRVNRSLETEKILLSHMDFSRVPMEICVLSTLRDLVLDGNDLSTLPPEATMMQNLRLLSMRNNKFARIPLAICSYERLTSLDLQGNPGIRRLPVEMGNCTALRKIDMDFPRILSPPDQIIQGGAKRIKEYLIYLREAQLTGNFRMNQMGLKYLPIEISMACGVFFEVDAVPSTFLTGFGKMQSLSYLQFKENNLQILPLSIRNFTALETLSLQYNNLKVLPIALAHCLELRFIDLGANQLTEWPAFLDRMTKLVKLRFDANQIPKIQGDIGRLENLTFLSIRRNLLHEVPQCLGEMTALTVLRVDRNHISSLPHKLFFMSQVQVLSFEGNPINHPPRELQEASTAEVLEYCRNLDQAQTTHSFVMHKTRLKSIPEKVMVLTDLKELCITSGRLNSLGGDKGDITKLVKLTRLDLSKNRVVALPEGVWSHLTELRELNVSGNFLKALPWDLGLATNLTSIRCNQSNIEYLPESICALTNLMVLELEGSSLLSLPEHFSKLLKLERLIFDPEMVVRRANEKLADKIALIPAEIAIKGASAISQQIFKMKMAASNGFLDLSNMRLRHIPADVWEITNLTDLRLGTNRIREISSDIQNNQMITNLDLDNNVDLKRLPTSMHLLTNLTRLSLRNVELECPPTVFALDLAVFREFLRLIYLSSKTNDLDFTNLLSPPEPESESDEAATDIFSTAQVKRKASKKRVKTTISAATKKSNVPHTKRLLTSAKKYFQPKVEYYDNTEYDEEIGSDSAVPNLFPSLPPDIWTRGLTNLTRLVIPYGTIDDDGLLPLKLTTHLRDLQLIDQAFSHLGLKIVSALTNLTLLRISGTPVKTLPKEMGCLHSLTDLAIADCKITSLPDELCLLTNLIDIHGAQNLLRELPRDFGNMCSLEFVDFDDNRLKTIPESVVHLTKLRELYLNANRLVGIPVQIGLLTQLKRLEFDHNPKISMPPPQYQRATLPQILFVLDKIRLSMENLALELRSVNLLDESVNKVCEPSPNLTSLDLAHNDISRLPSGFEKMTHLTALNISHNVLQTLSFTAQVIGGPKKKEKITIVVEKKPKGERGEGESSSDESSEFGEEEAIAQLEEYLSTIETFSEKSKRVLATKGLFGAVKAKSVGYGVAHKVYKGYLAIKGGKVVRKIADLLDEIRPKKKKKKKMMAEDEVAGAAAMAATAAAAAKDDDDDSSIDSDLNEETVEEEEDERVRREKEQAKYERWLERFAHAGAGNVNVGTMKQLVWSVTAFIGLVDFDVSYNEIQQIPMAIGLLTRLQRLQLSHNHIKDLPLSLTRLSSLVLLDISHNELYALPKDVGRLKSLKQCFLHNNQLHELPSSIEDCHDLEELTLGHNSLRKIHKLHSSSIHFLDLSHNNLGPDMPVGLNVCTNLRDLQLQGNSGITNIPEELDQLQKLEVLNLSDTGFTELPDQIEQFPRLRRLIMRDCWLVYISLRFATLTHLEVLELDGNDQLQFPPKVVQESGLGTIIRFMRRFVDAHLPEAVEIDISGFGLHEVPDQMYKMFSVNPRYQKLDASKNRIRKLTGHLKRFFLMTSVDLSENKLGQVPPILILMPQLLELDLSRNDIQQVDDKLCQLTQLTKLVLVGNRISELGDGIMNCFSLQLLDLSENRMMTIPKQFVGLVNLAVLNLSSNRFKKCPSVLGSLRGLRQLSLSSNSLSAISRSFKHLYNLSMLALSNNQFTCLQADIFSKMTGLQSLWLSQNSIQGLPPEIFYSCVNLEELWLHDNQLRALPLHIVQLTKLKVLTITGNLIQELHPDILGMSSLEEFWKEKNVKAERLKISQSIEQ